MTDTIIANAARLPPYVRFEDGICLLSQGGKVIERLTEQQALRLSRDLLDAVLLERWTRSR